MNGNYQNNYRGGWNHIPFIGFSPGPFNYNYPVPLYWPPFNYSYQIPHQNPANYTDNRPLLHHVRPPYVDNRHLPHQMPTYYYDPRHLTHPMPAHYYGLRPLPLRMPERHVDKGPLPHQTAEDHADNKGLPHQTPEEEEDVADKRPLPHQKADDDADNKCLPHRTSEECYADKTNLPQQSPDLSQQTPEDYVDKKCLPEPTIPAEATLPRTRCEICDVEFPHQNLEGHNNGKKHRRMLIELREQSTESKTSNGEESIHIQKKPVVQLKKVPKSKKDGCLVKITSHKAPKYEEVPAEGSKRKLRDHTGAEDRDSKVENVKHEARSFQEKKVTPVKSKRKVRDSTDAKDHGSKRETGEASGGKYMKMSNGIRRSVKNDQPQSTPVELNASSGSNISAETDTEYISCDFSATLSPEAPVTSQEFTPSPAVESSFDPSGQINSQTEVEEGEERLEVQNCGVETNDQPHSISMEFHGPAGCSDINTLVEDTCPDSGAIVLATPQSPIAFQVPTPVDIIQTEMFESDVHNEVQNDIVDSNDQQHLISMELHDTAGSMTNNQTEIVNFDSAAIEIVIEPLASAWPHAAGTSFEPLTELGLHTETEPQVSEAVAYIESQHPTEGTDIEIDAASEVSVETETEDGGSQVEVEMDVPASELGRIHLPQVSVCLTCGDEGFEEAIVYCSKCGDYAIHRYCLKGPVVFTDEVIWFCEDCEEILDANYPDSETADLEKCEVDSNEKCATFVDPQPIVDPIWRGSLQVFNKSFDKMSRLMGHLSTLACPKVLEETRHLPNALYGDLLQRSAVWPASFKKFGTNNLSIGLYFFPQNERVERYYDQLVDEMISNDLAIRVRVEKAELLIFASTMLPSQYKRFQSKYYLWGIFKRKQEPFR
ncbi:uncharacterized protein LOC131647481 [Vicia villosa]|uniref:uncharacterized protein LOC131647481 n=1 Tax=Vicia villosa TaxID=3911 RepID=UPI00273BDFDE|nr:uncharacterized protein LOC131647481 [Vicia villosa]